MNADVQSNPAAAPPTADRPVARPASGARPPVRLRGVRFDAITEAQCVEAVLSALDAGRGGYVVTPNLDHLRRAAADDAFARVLEGADLVVPDGMPLVWASRIRRTPLPERVAGSDLMVALAAGAARRGRTLFMLGGDPGAAEGAAEELRSRFPGLRIAGCHCPPYGFERDPAALAAVREALVATDPDIVYVGLGSPKQEMLIARLHDEFPRAWWLGIGMGLGFLAGQVDRAPRWMQRIGLEWLHRLDQEPRRLARRYLVQGLPFGVRLVASAVFDRFAGGERR